jgi:hypothetical protein
MTQYRIIILFAAVLFFTTYTKAQTENSSEDVRIVVQAGQLDILNNPLCIVPMKGLYVAVGNSLISIDAKDDESEISMNDDVYIDDIVSTGTDLIIKQDTALLSFTNDCKPIVAFNTSSFKMFSSQDGNLFIASKNDSISNLLFFDAKQKKIKPLSNFGEQVMYVSGDTLQCYVVTETKIYLFKKNTGIKLLEYTEPIITATLTENGILFSTKNKLLLLRSANRVNILAEFGCRRLLSYVNSFYAEYEDGSIIWYNFKKRE